MKKYAMLVLASTILFSVAVSSQEQTPPPGRKGERKEFKQNERLQVSPEKRAERMAKELELTDAQKAKVQALFEKQEATRVKRQSEVTKLREEHMAKFEAERKAQDADLIKIIGQDKFQKLENERAEHKAKMMERREGVQKHRAERGRQNKEYNRSEFQKVTAEKRADKMAKVLALTDIEKNKVQALFEKQDAKREQHQAAVKKVRDEQIAQFETERKAMNADLEKIIGTEKYQKLETVRHDMKDRMHARHEGNQGPHQQGEMMMKDHKQGGMAMMTPEKRAERMTKELGLTDAQKTEIQALFENQDAKRHQQMEKVAKMREELKGKFEAQRKANDEALTSIIGQDKFQKLQTMRTERMDKMKGMKKGHENHSPENNGDNK
jgi:periplasmic protein CpxP/Spy